MLKSTGQVRKVDELGRVVLPIEVRRRLDMAEKDSLEILVDEENGQVILQKAGQVCFKCAATDNLGKY